MQQVAMGWLVYRMTNSAFLLGVVGFLSQIPAFIFAPLGGVAADRLDRRRILIFTQILSMAQALVLAVLTLTGAVRAWHIIWLGFFLGCINSLDIPSRQAFIVEMVEKKENLANAIALNSLMFNAARLVGPSIAGILISVTGEGVCFLLNGLSFITVVISLYMMKMPPREKQAANPDVIKELKEGLLYAFNFIPIRMILFLLSVVSIAGMSYVVLMPIFARDVLRGGPQTLGFLMASAGVGALAATVYLASRKTVLGLGRKIPIYTSIFAVAIILFSLSHVLWLSLLLLMLAGFGFMSHMAASNTIIQTVVDDDKRGRVMSLYAAAFMGTVPIGSLLAGFMASKIGSTNTLIIGGMCCIAAALFFAAKLPVLAKHIHPIYRKIGIIPEVATGIGTITRISIPPED